MLKRIRGEYWAGWRAGMTGASYINNPNRNIIYRAIWDQGWHAGMVHQLNAWLQRKGR